MTWKVSGATGLPLADREGAWDAAAAKARVFTWAGFDGDNPDAGKARKAFFAYDDESPENKTSYKLPFADVIDGTLKAVPRGIFAVAAVLQGGRGGTDLPSDVLAAVKRKVAGYYGQLDEEAPWERKSISHDQVASELQSALENAFGRTVIEVAPSSSRLWITEVFDDHVIFTKDDQLFSINYAIENNEVVLRGEPQEVERRVEYDAKNTLVSIKSITDDKATLAGYLAVFDLPDITPLKDIFTPETDFWLDKLPGLPIVLYEHGLHPEVKHTVLGKIVKAATDDVGLWVEAELDVHRQYVEHVLGLIKRDANALGWSAGAISHLVERVLRAGKSYITSWPIVEATLTTMPAHPFTLGVQEIHSLANAVPAVKAFLPKASEEDAASATEEAEEAVDVTETIQETEVKTIMDNDKTTSMAQPDPQPDPSPQPIEVKVDLSEFDAMFKRLTENQEALLAALRDEPPQKQGLALTSEGGETKSFADWFMAVRRNDKKRLAEVYATKAALSESGGTTGGYLVPDEFIPTLLAVAAEDAVVRPRAYIQPMKRRSVLIPALDQTTAPSAGDTAFFGGLIAYWTEEGATKTETEPTFKQIELVAHKLAGYTEVDDEVLADSAISLEALLTRLFGQAITWYEDYAFLRGDGVGKPLGVLNSGAAISVQRNTANDFKFEDASAMLSKLLPTSIGKAVWVIHNTVQDKLIQMADAGNNAVWIPNAREKLPLSLFGMPVVVTDKVPALGTAGDVMLCDFSYYIIGDRQSVEIARSEHFKFTSDKTTWRFVHRVDGQPWLDSYITLSDASSTISPFVYLTDPAA